jgi:hypothetical protein
MSSAGGRGKPTDLRADRRREQRRLIAIVAAFLVVVGTVVIAFVYGPAPAILGLLCLLTGAAVLVLLWGILHFIERIAG